MTHASVSIQITPESSPSIPSWMGEVAAFAQVLTHEGILKAIAEQVRFARARFGHYDLVDFVAVLIGYILSGEPTLLAFYERLAPFAEPFMALFGRNRLPHRSTLSRFLAALDQASVEALRSLFHKDVLARQPFPFPSGLCDRTGGQWSVIDVDGTRQTARQRALPGSVAKKKLICYSEEKRAKEVASMSNRCQNPFKWRHFQSDILLLCVRWYLRYSLSYRDLEEMMWERGLHVDHTTIYRWVQHYAPELERRCRPHLKSTTGSWRVDETSIKVKKPWVYLYRAVDSQGNTLDFLFSQTRDATAAKQFLLKTLTASHTSSPRVINVDKNAASPKAFNELKAAGHLSENGALRQVKYLNNLIEQDHRAHQTLDKTWHGFLLVRDGMANITRI